MIGWAILAIIILAVTGLLLAPVRLEIDTRQNLARLHWQGIIAVQWLPDEALDCVSVRNWLFHKKIFVTRSKALKADKLKPHKQEPSSKKTSRLKIKTLWRLAGNIVRSFTVRKCRISWDTDHFMWNAWLYPLAQQWGRDRVQINFQGRQEIELVVENRLGNLAGAALKTFIF